MTDAIRPEKELVQRALAKLNEDYTSVFQIRIGEPDDHRPFEWKASGSTILEVYPQETTMQFDAPVAYFEENIDARFTEMAWHVMKNVRDMLSFYATGPVICPPIDVQAIARSILESP